MSNLPNLDNEGLLHYFLILLIIQVWVWKKAICMASKLSRFGICESGYLVIQTDLPSLDNKENGLLNSTVVFTLIQVWVQEKTSFGK